MNYSEMGAHLQFFLVHNPCKISVSSESRRSGLDTLLEALLLAIDKLCQPSATALGRKDFGDTFRNC